jgi:hypothetical protein
VCSVISRWPIRIESAAVVSHAKQNRVVLIAQLNPDVVGASVPEGIRHRLLAYTKDLLRDRWCAPPRRAVDRIVKADRLAADERTHAFTKHIGKIPPLQR